MAVELRLMRYVVAVADAGGFQRAARELRIAQPSLSRQIRDLEQRLGTPLFDRRPTQLTEAGRLFVDAARRVLADTDQMVARTRRAGKLPSGTVRVGYTVSAAYRDMPRARVVAPRMTAARCASGRRSCAASTRGRWATNVRSSRGGWDAARAARSAAAARSPVNDESSLAKRSRSASESPGHESSSASAARHKR